MFLDVLKKGHVAEGSYACLFILQQLMLDKFFFFF